MASSEEIVRLRLLDVEEAGDDCFHGHQPRSSTLGKVWHVATNAQEGPLLPRGELRLRLGVDR